jgi:two-component system, cell cycle sensor histidine kinase and response regulator CckA
MTRLHSLLQRQLRRTNLSIENLPREVAELVASVNEAYFQFDDDRGMLERSLDLSSHELLQANQEMRALFQAIPDLLFRLDREGRIVECRGGKEGFYLQPKELVGKRFQDLPVRDPALRFAEALAAVHETRGVLSVEYSLGMPEGERFYEVRFIPLQDGQTIAIVRDITARKKAADELYHSQQMLKLVLDNIPQRVFWKDRRSVYLGCNRSFAQDTGLRDPEEVIGRDDFAFVFRESADLYRADDALVMETGASKLNFEEPQDRPGSTALWLRTSKVPLCDRRGQVIGILGTYEDITEQKRAEEALRQSEERYRIAAETTGQLIYDWSPGSGAVRWAGAIEVLTGDPPEEFARLQRDGWAERIHPDDREAAAQALRNAVETGADFRAEYRFRRRDGSYLHMEDNGAFVKDEAGRPSRMLGAMKDISERVRAREEREKAEEQLRQAAKMEAVGRLAGGVAHDFNNILTGILGYTELLIDSVAVSDPMHVELAEIHRAAKRAASLTAQLLAFSRKQIIDPKVLSLGELISASSKMVERLIGADIELIFVAGEKPDRIKADPGQIEQVLVNLAVNARDAMPDGGQLTIEISLVAIDEAYCAFHSDARPGHYVQLTVSDTGCGMSEETLEHLFEPFYTTKERGRGTGLGLSTIYGIVRQNNGFITVYSQLGHGSAFRIHLPRVFQKADVLPKWAATTLPSGHETVLLVEDEEVVRNLARQILGRQGYKVLVAANGLEACALSEGQEAEIDLLLTDVVMPQMDGKQLYERLRRSHPTLKVLFMSGYTEETIVHRGLLDQGTNFLQKPFTLDILVRRVRQVLDPPR